MTAWEFQQIPPPGARGKFDPKLYQNPGWYAEEKLDGDRRIAQFCSGTEATANVRFTGRRVSDVDGKLVEKTDCLPHLSGLLPFVVPNTPRQAAPLSLIGTVLDGEIVVDKPGARSKDVTSIIGSKPALAIQKQQERGWLVYTVFDCLFYKGTDVRDLPLHLRRCYVAKVLAEWENPYVREVRDSIMSGVPAEQLVTDIWARGGEGIILKDLNSTYGNEKAWVKVKREFTEDVVIIGYDEPEAETEKVETYKDEGGVRRKRVLEVSESRLAKNGWIGAIRFGQWKPATVEEIQLRTIAFGQAEIQVVNGIPHMLTYCGSCSGMTDEVRKQLSENREANIGRVVEILANEREPDTYKFRHPRFIQFRDDKNAVDCIWGQK